MPERLQVMTLLAAWCGLRFGELAELRRKDVDLKAGQLRIRRAAVRVHGQTIVDTPKTDAGTRDVAVPPHLVSAVEEHLATHTQPGKNAVQSGAAIALAATMITWSDLTGRPVDQIAPSVFL